MNIHQISTEPALLSLTAIAQAIAAKRVSSREVTQSCLDRIAQWQPRLNAFMAIEAEQALAAADAADAALAKGKVGGALHGVPLAHQDMYYDDDLDRPAAPERCRDDSSRFAADVGIRLWTDRPQLALRSGA